jgi:hypothetical protein
MSRGAPSPALAAPEGASGERELKVIAPGNEPLLGEMLGGSLPGGCALEGASIDRTRIVARYACADGPASLTLLHPSDPGAPADALRTAAFAVAGPPALRDAVAAQLRAREATFRWVTVEAGPAAPGPTEALAGPPPPHRFFAEPASFGAAALALAVAASAALFAALRRRSRA